jgi:hypothetical protein
MQMQYVSHQQYSRQGLRSTKVIDECRATDGDPFGLQLELQDCVQDRHLVEQPHMVADLLPLLLLTSLAAAVW